MNDEIREWLKDTSKVTDLVRYRFNALGLHIDEDYTGHPGEVRQGPSRQGEGNNRRQSQGGRRWQALRRSP